MLIVRLDAELWRGVFLGDDYSSENCPGCQCQVSEPMESLRRGLLIVPVSKPKWNAVFFSCFVNASLGRTVYPPWESSLCWQITGAMLKIFGMGNNEAEETPLAIKGMDGHHEQQTWPYPWVSAGYQSKGGPTTCNGNGTDIETDGSFIVLLNKFCMFTTCHSFAGHWG